MGFFFWSGSVGVARETDDLWIRGVFTGKSPRSVTLSETDAWQCANTFAEKAPNSFVLVGSGHSMHPLYTPGTILVLQKFPYELLERGQTVLYRNQARKTVAYGSTELLRPAEFVRQLALTGLPRSSRGPL